MKYTYKSEQSGRSMVEMLGVLAIVGVLSVGGIAGYSKAMAKFKVSKMQDNLSMLMANIRTLYGSQGNFNGLTHGVLLSSGSVPSDMYSASTFTATTPIYSPWGGAVTIAAAGTDDRQFTIEVAGLPADACVTMTTADWGAGVASLKTNTEEFTEDDLPANVADATSACNGSTATGNTLTWTFN